MTIKGIGLCMQCSQLITPHNFQWVAPLICEPCYEVNRKEILEFIASVEQISTNALTLAIIAGDEPGCHICKDLVTRSTRWAYLIFGEELQLFQAFFCVDCYNTFVELDSKRKPRVYAKV